MHFSEEKNFEYVFLLDSAVLAPCVAGINPFLTFLRSEMTLLTLKSKWTFFLNIFYSRYLKNTYFYHFFFWPLLYRFLDEQHICWIFLSMHTRSCIAFLYIWIFWLMGSIFQWTLRKVMQHCRCFRLMGKKGLNTTSRRLCFIFLEMIFHLLVGKEAVERMPCEDSWVAAEQKRTLGMNNHPDGHRLTLHLYTVNHIIIRKNDMSTYLL